MSDSDPGSDMSELPPSLQFSDSDAEAAPVPVAEDPAPAELRIAEMPAGSEIRASAAPATAPMSIVVPNIRASVPAGAYGSFLPGRQPRGRGRGCGRPRKEPQGPLALAVAPHDHILSLAVPIAAAGNASAAAPSPHWSQWLCEETPGDVLAERAKARSGTHGLGSPVVIGGIATSAADAEATVAAAILGASSIGREESGTARLLGFFLSKPTFSLTSTAAAAAMLGMEPKTVRASIVRTGAAIAILSAKRRFDLEKGLVVNFQRKKLLHYCEVVQYDETPST